MTVSIRKILFLFLALSTTLPAQASLDELETLTYSISRNHKIQYDSNHKKVIMFSDVSASKILGTGLRSIIYTSISGLCMMAGMASDDSDLKFAAFIGGGFMAISGVLDAIEFTQLNNTNSSNKPYVIMDPQGIACSSWGSVKKIHWNQVKNIATSSKTDQYGAIIYQKCIFNLTNGSRYSIYAKNLPVTFNTFCEIIDYLSK